VHRILNKDGTIDNLDVRIEMTLSTPSGDGKIVLESIADRIIYKENVDAYTSSEFNFIDAHGEHTMDLDGDGIVDRRWTKKRV
jgi:hypothetical protein